MKTVYESTTEEYEVEIVGFDTDVVSFYEFTDGSMNTCGRVSMHSWQAIAAARAILSHFNCWSDTDWKG